MRTGTFYTVNGRSMVSNWKPSGDLIPASVLIFPFFISGSNPVLEDTIFTINNIHSSLSTPVTVYFVSNAGDVVKVPGTISAGSSLQILASASIPNKFGYAIVVTKGADGYSSKFNYLTGSMRIIMETGHSGTFYPTGVKCLRTPGKPVVYPGDPTPADLDKISIPFDGKTYEFLAGLRNCVSSQNSPRGNSAILVPRSGIGSNPTRWYERFENLPMSEECSLTGIESDSLVVIASVSGDLSGSVGLLEPFQGCGSCFSSVDNKTILADTSLTPTSVLYYGTLVELFPKVKSILNSFFVAGPVSANFKPTSNANLFGLVINK